ncbi:MAG: transglutaminase domain-containing protein [Anaerolineales bacterium]|jgi:transglutaminase-like putative cysteine protease|nr:transglutaminase domain-containing protein [Anaerolineales bacterium]
MKKYSLLILLFLLATPTMGCSGSVRPVNTAIIESGRLEGEDAFGSDVLKTGNDTAAVLLDSIEYEIVERLTVVNEGPGVPSKQNLWMALIRDVYPYQEVISIEITPGDYQINVDEYGNQYAEFDLSDMPAGTSIQIELKYLVMVNELVYDLSKCEGEMLEAFTHPELHIESNNVQITSLAEELADDRDTACEQVRAFYDFIGDNLVYSYNGGDWGAQAALGEMGADCTEYADLMIALNRASGIPARYFEGLYFAGEQVNPEVRTEHAWLDVYLPGTGWTAMDPTLGRSSQNREEYFAHYQPNHIIVTQGRNPSTLRGASYWTYIYWPGESTKIKIEDFEWEIERVGE